MSTIMNSRLDDGCRRRMLASMVFVLAALALPTSMASAQANCQGLTSTQCAQASDQYQLLSVFSTLPSSPGGVAFLQNVLAADIALYQNATPAQRNQAAANADLTDPVPQQNIWSMLTSTNQLFPTLAQTFPQVRVSAPLAATVGAQLPTQSGVYAQITSLLDNIGSVQQIGALKDAFTSYAQVFQQVTSFANSGNVDPRPFQTSLSVGGAPWTGNQASASAQSTQNAQWLGLLTSGAFPSGHSAAGFTSSLLYAIMLPQAYQSLIESGEQFALSRNIIGAHYPTDVIGSRILTYYTMTQLLANNPLYNIGISNFQAYTQQLGNQLSASLGSAAAVPYANCASTIASCIASGTFATASQLTAANNAYVQQATYGLSFGATNLAPVVPQNAQLLIASRFPYLSNSQLVDVLATTELPSGVPLDDGSGWARLNLFAAGGGYGAFNANVTVNMNAALGGFNAIDFWTNNIGGSGSLTKTGTGVLVLGGNETYTGGTTVTGGTLALTGTMIGNLTIGPAGTFVTNGGYSVSPSSTLTNAGTFQSVNATLLNQGTLSNTGTLLSSVTNTGSFVNNGQVTGTLSNFGMLSGSGQVTGTLTNSGILSPGSSGSNSIGTMAVSGGFVNAGSGVYAAEVNGTTQNDQIAVNGAATLQGGSVYVFATPGTVYGPTQTYKILSATGGLSGTFASVNEIYPFLLSSLSYDANNAYLTLQVGGFAAAAATPTQYAVGAVLDANVGNATGDFASVLSAMAVNVTSNAQGQAVLQSLSGNNYAGFSSTMVQGAQLFMNNFANQAGGGQAGGGQAGGGGSPTSNRVAMAEACEVACDTTTTPLWGAWGGGLGGLGTIGGTSSVGAVTYNAGGFAAGLDRAITDSLRVGVTAGYAAGTQWVNGFSGTGRSDTFQTGLYANFAQDKVYADALLGYAYTWNQMWRQIAIPGLQPRTALGQTGANQFFGQIETGYRFDLRTNAQAFITPFARLQAYTGNQNAFTETGAQSLNLTVNGQNTNSLRTVLGAQVGGAMDLGWREKLALQLRLGWSHEYADVSRPVTATLAGAPAMPFTTWGISPQRDGAVIGFSASTSVAEATSVYLRYEGNISGQDNAQAFTAGLRMTW